MRRRFAVVITIITVLVGCGVEGTIEQTTPTSQVTATKLSPTERVWLESLRDRSATGYPDDVTWVAVGDDETLLEVFALVCEAMDGGAEAGEISSFVISTWDDDPNTADWDDDQRRANYALVYWAVGIPVQIGCR